ncbi:hypothetical protein EI42_03599 [Thermosporothrix hazakensis]|jgi:predicted metal-binding membrane protein|uniref:Uncharacterized protein n=2 Tax=Thermosporothrix TaxID=768650 RepID=A0A326U655_THEHA|nr:hypothetical protein [Thermosporothrix hazakensis]PZW27512.1 hypothetical protein EI42_03599 [Thermosporothrix hazakensis]BBH85895.1 hypothetical protein KTC_06460 [Thermosporothrix sp. COM3]GCE45678.1 hypothetical protein KTH_05470 [Thermosporothrix hazakensis]
MNTIPPAVSLFLSGLFCIGAALFVLLPLVRRYQRIAQEKPEPLEETRKRRVTMAGILIGLIAGNMLAMLLDWLSSNAADPPLELPQLLSTALVVDLLFFCCILDSLIIEFIHRKKRALYTTPSGPYKKVWKDGNS